MRYLLVFAFFLCACDSSQPPQAPQALETPAAAPRAQVVESPSPPKEQQVLFIPWEKQETAHSGEDLEGEHKWGAFSVDKRLKEGWRVQEVHNGTSGVVIVLTR